MIHLDRLAAKMKTRPARRLAGAAAAILVLWAVVGFLVLPPLLRPVLQRKIAEQLHRPVTVRGLSINPFALSARVEGLDIKDKGGVGPFVSVARLYVNFEAVSLLRGGPVIRAITVTRPSITLVRKKDGTYNFQDLLDAASKPGPAPKPLRFSLNNIRIEGGSIDFDDRPMGTKHAVRDLEIGVPFLSNIPSKVDITTRPVFEAIVNGAPFALHGHSEPFSETRETTLNIDLSDVDLAHYLSYIPSSIPPRLTAGRLDAKITVAFTQPPGQEPALVLSGTTVLRKLAVEGGGQPLLSCDRFEVALDSFDVFGRRIRVRRIRADGPEIWVRREKTGGDNITAAFAASPARGGKTPAASGPAMSVQIAGIQIEGGRIHYDDLSLDRPFHALVGDLAASVRGLSTARGKTASVEISAKTDAGEMFKNAGTVSMAPFVLEGALEIGGIPLKRYAPFYDKRVLADVDGGVLDLATKYRFSSGPAGNTTLSGLHATLTSPRLRKRGEKKPFFQAPLVTVAGAGFDLAKRDAQLGEISSAGGLLAVVRDKDGNADLAQLVAAPPPGAPEPPSAPWNVALEKLALDGYTIRMEDHAPDRLARFALTKTNVLLEKFSTAPGTRGTLSVRFGVDGKGTASAKGPVGIHPTYAELRTDVRRLGLVPLEAYVLPGVRLSLARGTLSGAGMLSLREDARGKPTMRFAGRASVGNLLAVDQATGLDFFKWKSFSAAGLKAGYNPMFLDVARLAVSGTECDLVVEADGVLNLKKIVGPPLPAEGEAVARPEPAAPAGRPPAKPSAPSAADERMPIHIGELVVENGRIRLADRSVHPSYDETLGDLNGRVAGLSTKEGTVARIEASATLASRSPLEIAGRINPLAAAAFADVTASVRGVDLPPFTPYSGKYIGYTIARGSLTMNVHYALQNRKLDARNKFLVDQLELGDKVQSKDATKLPVRLAISLLKDRNGLIDLDLPIQGSLDDPKFRIGKVIWKILGNLVGKAATAPFALLGNLFGGHPEQLSSVGFADGSEVLGEEAVKKLDALATALRNRPALRLEAAGRFSGEADREGLRRLRMERLVKAQKLAELAKKGEAPASVDDVVVSESEYPVYLKKAYRKGKFRKPRGFLGIPKDLPPPEMEKLLLASVQVTDDDLRQLALSRANAVKDYLTGPGKVEPARVFVVEPGRKPAEAKGEAGASRVDFTLK